MHTIKASAHIEYNDLAGISCFKSKDECRFILLGIEIEISEEGVMLAATDGKILGLLKIPLVGQSKKVDGHCLVDTAYSPCRFVVDPSLALRKLKKSGKIKVELFADDSKQEYVEFSQLQDKTVVSIVSPRIDVENLKYPKFTQIVPTNPAKIDPSISRKLLNQIFKASMFLSDKDDAVHFWGTKDTDSDPNLQPISFFFSGDPRFYGVAMPMRSDTPGKIFERKVPDWARQRKEYE